MRKVLHRDGNEHRVERGIVVRQVRLGIQVVNHPRIQARVGRQLIGIHPQASHVPVSLILRQMRNPRRHEIQDPFVAGKHLSIVVRECRDGDIIDVRDQPRLGVKRGVSRFVDPLKEVFGKF